MDKQDFKKFGFKMCLGRISCIAASPPFNITQILSLLTLEVVRSLTGPSGGCHDRNQYWIRRHPKDIFNIVDGSCAASQSDDMFWSGCKIALIIKEISVAPTAGAPFANLF